MFNRRRMVFCCGQGAGEENSLAATRRLEQVFLRKGIRARMDYWGFDVDHSWFWWNQQMPYFLPTSWGRSPGRPEPDRTGRSRSIPTTPTIPTPPSHPGSGCSTLKRTLIEKKEPFSFGKTVLFVGEIFSSLMFLLFLTCVGKSGGAPVRAPHVERERRNQFQKSTFSFKPMEAALTRDSCRPSSAGYSR